MKKRPFDLHSNGEVYFCVYEKKLYFSSIIFPENFFRLCVIQEFHVHLSPCINGDTYNLNWRNS